jgi:hypothetical protein
VNYYTQLVLWERVPLTFSPGCPQILILLSLPPK